jgi:hypothetical protein
MCVGSSRCAARLRCAHAWSAPTPLAPPAKLCKLLCGHPPRSCSRLFLSCPHAVERCTAEAEQCGELLLPEAARAREAVQRWRAAATAETRLSRALRDGVGTAHLSRAIKEAAAAGVKVGEARRLLKLMQGLEAAMQAAAEGPLQYQALKVGGSNCGTMAVPSAVPHLCPDCMPRSSHLCTLLVASQRWRWRRRALLSPSPPHGAAPTCSRDPPSPLSEMLEVPAPLPPSGPHRAGGGWRVPRGAAVGSQAAAAPPAARGGEGGAGSRAEAGPGRRQERGAAAVGHQGGELVGVGNWWGSGWGRMGTCQLWGGTVGLAGGRLPRGNVLRPGFYLPLPSPLLSRGASWTTEFGVFLVAPALSCAFFPELLAGFPCVVPAGGPGQGGRRAGDGCGAAAAAAAAAGGR